MKSLWTILLFLFTIGVWGQQFEIKGTVVSDTDDIPIPGVNVSIKGKSVGTTTDFDGEFNLEVEEGAILIFSMVGFEDFMVKVEDQGTIDVRMKEGSTLDEVVITGYTSEKKADITGAVSVVDMDNTMKQSEPNPVQALQGRVPGVNISTDGSPSGGNTKVLIRGVGTLNNTDPLYVIDGVPTKGGMQELNPDDIESIQVLKDAASASIYGSRASNGVIVITTKTGKKGRMRINLKHYTSFSQYPKKLPVLNAKEFGEVLWQAHINDGLDPNSNNIRYNFDWKVEDNIPVLEKILVPEFLDSEKTLKSSNTDWFDEISQTGISNVTNLSVSNNSEKGAYYFSLGHYDGEGIVKETNFKRWSARVNTSFNLFDGKLKVGENLTINRTQEVQDPGVLDPALRAMPIVPVHTVDGEGWGGPVTGMNDRQNPVRLLEYNKDNGYKYSRVFGNAYAEFKPIENLTLKTNFGIDYSLYHKRELQRSYVSGFLKNDKTSVFIDNTISEKFTWTNTGQYELTLDEHRFNFLVGTEIYRDNFDNSNLRREDFLIESTDYMYPDAGSGESFTGGSSTRYNLASFFGKLNYDFKDKYLFSATLRYDGSSRFGRDNRYGTFPAFSAGWKINKEDFFQENLPVFSDLRLRVGWGQTGNQEISNEAVYSLYRATYAGGDPTWDTSFGTAYDIAGVGSGHLPSGFISTQLGNNQLRWETTTQTNIGLDFGLFSQALTGSVEVYKKSTKDILVLPPYLAVIGEGGGRWVNGANMENKGLEFSLQYRNTTESGFSYAISGNMALNKNKITNLPDEVKNSYGGNGTTDNILGRPINSIYGYVADGLFKSQEEVSNSAEQSGKDLGRIRYKDLNDDGKIDDKDRTWIGNPNPLIIYGLNIELEYKGFELTTFWQGVGDVDIVNDIKYQSDFWSVDDIGSNKGTRLLDAWSPQNSDSDIPAVTMTDKNAENRMSTYFVENGSYLKLRLIQLGYNFPKSFTDQYGVDNLRIYVSGQNMWTIKSKSFTGVDPETPNFGYPLPRTFNVGVNISL